MWKAAYTVTMHILPICIIHCALGAVPDQWYMYSCAYFHVHSMILSTEGGLHVYKSRPLTLYTVFLGGTLAIKRAGILMKLCIVIGNIG